MVCDLCGEECGENWKEIEGQGRYCHNADWVIEGGTCWEQIVVAGTPMEEWLWLLFECDGCEPDEWGECTCVGGEYVD